MVTPLTVLILEDRPADAMLMLHELRRAGFEPTWQRVETETDYLAHLHAHVDVILADYALPQFDALRALALLQERGWDIPFFIVSGTIGEDRAVFAMQQGATDYLLKDRLARLGPAVLQALQQRQLRASEMRVQQQLARLALLNQITRAIGERQDLHSIFLVVLRHLEQDLPLAFACFCLGAPGNDTLTVTAVAPTSQAFATAVGLEEQVVVSLEQMELRACMDGQTVSVLDTAQALIPVLRRFAQAGLRSLIATPCLVEDSVFGLLLAARHEIQGFSSGEGEFLRQLSEHVALATHRARLYTKLLQAYDDLRQTQQDRVTDRGPYSDCSRWGRRRPGSIPHRPDAARALYSGHYGLRHAGHGWPRGSTSGEADLAADPCHPAGGVGSDAAAGGDPPAACRSCTQ